MNKIKTQIEAIATICTRWKVCIFQSHTGQSRTIVSNLKNQIVKNTKLILLLTFLSSCSINNSVVGLYGKCEKHYFACSQIELKPDKTFEYFIFMDVGGASLTKGNWEKISNDTIVLNTFNQPKNPKTTYQGRINHELIDTIKIRISDKNGPVEFAIVHINNTVKKKETDSNGMVEFNSKSLQNIEYVFLSQKEKIPINNPKYNEIEILIRDLDINSFPDYLTDYKIVLKGKQLIFDSKYSLTKTNPNQKQWK